MLMICVDTLYIKVNEVFLIVAQLLNRNNYFFLKATRLCYYSLKYIKLILYMKRREKLKELEQRHKMGNFIRFVTRHYTISTLV